MRKTRSGNVEYHPQKGKLSLVKKICMLFALCAAFCCAVPLFAADRKDYVYETFTPEMVLEIMKGEGYDVTLKTKKSEKYILWVLGGCKSVIAFYNDNHSIQFYIRFADTNASLIKHNAFNNERRYGKSVKDETGGDGLEVDLSFVGGITKKRLIDFFELCRVLLSKWREEVL